MKTFLDERSSFQYEYLSKGLVTDDFVRLRLRMRSSLPRLTELILNGMFTDMSYSMPYCRLSMK